MLTFAIALLLTAGAAFALLVIVGMLAGNWRAIASALAGQGGFAGQRADAGGLPPLVTLRLRVGQMRQGRRIRQGQAVPFSPLRAAA